MSSYHSSLFPGGSSSKEVNCQCRRLRICGINPWVRKIPQRRKWQPTPVFLSGKSCGQRSLMGYSPWGHKVSNTLNMHVQILCSWAPKSVWMVTAAMKLKNACSFPWKETYDKPRQRIKKQRYHFADKGLYSQRYGFSSSHVQIWELDHKTDWVLKNWCFQTVVLEKTLESPLDFKEIKPVNPKGNQAWIFIGGTDAEAEAPMLWHLMWRAWKRPWWERLKTKGEGGSRGWQIDR